MARKKITHAEQTSSHAFISLDDLGIAKDSICADISPKAFAVVTRSLLQNWRQGTVACKGRSDVSFSNKKPWKQKGTGRARAGSARSPIWRGGGVTFGPQARTRTLKVPRKLVKAVMGNIFAEFIEGKRVIALDWHAPELPKTSVASAMIKNAQLHDKKINLFLSPNDTLARASFINIPNVQILFFDQPNVYDLANNSYWVFLKKDADAFKEMVTRWI